jgi:hypothetical protein
LSLDPVPDSWGIPAADFPLGFNCPSSNFANNWIVIDNTFCGSWAGAVFDDAGSGCSGSCQTYVQNNPSMFQCPLVFKSSTKALMLILGDFTQAYWAINSFKVYQP